MGDKRLGSIIPETTKRVGVAILEEQHDLLNGEKEVYKQFTSNIELIRKHLSTFDKDFSRTRGRMTDAFRLLEKYVKRDFHFAGKRKPGKFSPEEQLFFVQHSEHIIRGVLARIVHPENFKEVDGLDLEFYSNISRKLSVQLAPPPSKEVMMLAMNQISEAFERISFQSDNNDRRDFIDPFSHNFEDTQHVDNEDVKNVLSDPLEIVRNRLIGLDVEPGCREILEQRSEHFIELAQQLDRSLRINRAASPPRPDWSNVKLEVIDDDYENEYQIEATGSTPVLDDVKEMNEELHEEPTKKKVHFAKINKANGGLYESVDEIILFNHICSSYRKDIGLHVAQVYRGDSCDVSKLMRTALGRKIDEISTTKKANAESEFRNLLRSLRRIRPENSNPVQKIRTPIHLDLQPVDSSNKFSDQEAEDYLVNCVKTLNRFSSNWAGIKISKCPEKDYESNCYGILILTDSLLEDVDPRFFLNGTIISLPPPLKLDDILFVLNKCRYDNLNMRDIVLSFGHDILTYTGKVTDEVIESAVRQAIEAVDRIKAVFMKRQQEFLEIDPKYGILLDIAPHAVRVKELPLPNIYLLTIPEYGNRSRAFAKYNAILRKISPALKNCTMIDWAAFKSEEDKGFQEMEESTYDDLQCHIKNRIRHLAKILYKEMYLLHFRENEERFPANKRYPSEDNMV